MEKLARAQTEVSTGRRIQTVSDDPVVASQVLRADSGLRGLEQYRRNSTAARTRLDAEESVLSQMTDLISRAKELAIGQGSSGGNATTQAAALAEVDRIIEQVVSLGNTQVGNEFLFGGHQTNARPFDSAGTYSGDTGVRQAEVGQGYLMTTNHTGQDLMVNSGVITSLQTLRSALAAGNPTAIGASGTGLDTAFDNVQQMLATTGARTRQLDSAAQNLDALGQSLQIRRSDYAEVDFEAATLKFLGLQSSLQAALGTASRLLTTNLTEYLR